MIAIRWRWLLYVIELLRYGIVKIEEMIINWAFFFPVYKSSNFSVEMVQ